MKKYCVVLALLLLCLALIGCEKKDENPDYSQFLFTDISWTRTTEYDTEYIRFRANGEFSYYCACGNPVNDSDLCEGYSYDDDTKTITLDYDGDVFGVPTELLVMECDGATLKLDFNGEIREFTKE